MNDFSLAKWLDGAADLLMYSTIRAYIDARIAYFTEQLLANNLKLALTVILTLMTLWIMVQGFMIATGRSREGLKEFIMNGARAYLVVAAALGAASTHELSVRTLTTSINNNMAQIIAEKSSNCLMERETDILGCKIDKQLKITQGLMAFINTVDTANTEENEQSLNKAKWFAGVGAAGPAVVSGTMLILYRLAIALFIGFAPFFILCLLFKRSAPLFQKWLYYGIATVFSAAMLALMSDISADLVEHIATGLFVAEGLTRLGGGDGGGMAGVMEAATQQLGLGLVLSALLITAPPMAGSWFNGVMGNFQHYSAFGNWNSRNPQGHPNPHTASVQGNTIYSSQYPNEQVNSKRNHNTNLESSPHSHYPINSYRNPTEATSHRLPEGTTVRNASSTNPLSQFGNLPLRSDNPPPSAPPPTPQFSFSPSDPFSKKKDKS